MTRNILRKLLYGILAGTALILLGLVLLYRQWQVRGSIDDIGWQSVQANNSAPISVHATWLGVSTILFDDGETQILLDGAFTRLTPVQILTFRRARSDIATINHALAEFEVNRLAAILPVHSHFDHAIDIGEIANRTSAVILGSESSANIARGANVPVDQYQILADEETRRFGDFSVTLLASKHVPTGWGDDEIFSGFIDEPLEAPARASEYKTGLPWTVVVDHPSGSTMVQGSAGFVAGKLRSHPVDVVMLSVAGLAALGRDYTERYWDETVTASGASRVIAIHHDDFTLPFGEVQLMPTMLDDVPKAARWIDAVIESSDSEIFVELPVFGQPIDLY